MKSALVRLYQPYGAVFRQWPALRLIMLTVFLAELAYAIIIPTLPLHLKNQIHAPVLAIGIVFATFALVETLFKTPAGAMSDHYGRLRIILLGLVAGMISPLLMTVAGYWQLFVLLRAIDGLAVSAVWPALIALISEKVRPKEKATALAAFNLAWISGVGLGPAIGLEIGHRFHSNIYAFYTAGILLFCAAVAAAVVWSGERRRQQQAAPASRDKMADSGPPARRTWRETLRRLRARRPVLLHMLWILGLMQFGLTMLVPVIVLYAQSVLGMTQHQMSQAFLVPAVVIAALALPLGRWADHLGRDRAIHLALPILALALVSIPLLREMWMLMVVAAVIGLCFDLATPSWLALTSQLAPDHRQGLALGAMNTAQGVGFILGPVVGAALYEQVSVNAPFWVAGVVMAVTAMAAIVLIRAPLDDGGTEARGGASQYEPGEHGPE